MSRVVWYTGTDCGDGSLSVEFFDSRICIELLEEINPESYRGEGGNAFTLKGEIEGITIQTLEDVIDELTEWDEYTREELEEIIERLK